MECEGDDPQPKQCQFSMPFLPAEVIYEILLRLPVKSLCRFRCVSNSSLALISTPEFVKTHLSMSANNKDDIHHRLMVRAGLIEPEYNLMDCSLSSVLYDSVATRPVDLDYPMKDPHRLKFVLGSVNGLICFFFHDQDFFIVWNPSIRKSKKIPHSKFELMYGFGYDDVRDDYKVVSIYSGTRRSKVNIYSLSSDSCTSRIEDIPNGRLLGKLEGMFVNGKLHWATNMFGSHKGGEIISIDIADGKWEKMELPYYREGYFGHIKPCVGVLGSDLSVFCNSQLSYTDVWIMKEYGVKESWTKLFTIERPWSNSYNERSFSPLFCMNKGEILTSPIDKAGRVNKRAFMIYNPKNDSIRYQEVTNCGPYWDAYIYIESLVWPFC